MIYLKSEFDAIMPAVFFYSFVKHFKMKLKFQEVLQKVIKKYFCTITNDRDFDRAMRLPWLLGLIMAKKENKARSFLISTILYAVMLPPLIMNVVNSYEQNKSLLRPIAPMIILIRNTMINIELFAMILQSSKIKQFIEKNTELVRRYDCDQEINTESEGHKLIKRCVKIHIRIIFIVWCIRIVKIFVDYDKLYFFLNHTGLCITR
jgi:hypothetical protein